MGKKKIFDMGRDLHKMSRDDLQSILENDNVALTFEKASQPDLPDPFQLREDHPHGTPPRWLYIADLVVSIIKPLDDPDRGVYIIKNRFGSHGRATMGQVIDIAMELLKVEFGLNVGFFEDAVTKEIREAIVEVLLRHRVLPKKEAEQNYK